MRPTLRNIFVGASFEGRHGGIALLWHRGSGPLAPEWANTSGKGSDTPSRAHSVGWLSPFTSRRLSSSGLRRTWSDRCKSTGGVIPSACLVRIHAAEVESIDQLADQ